jgi:hypothetical protein
MGLIGLLRRLVLSWLRNEYGTKPVQEAVKSSVGRVKIASRIRIRILCRYLFLFRFLFRYLFRYLFRCLFRYRYLFRQLFHPAQIPAQALAQNQNPRLLDIDELPARYSGI